MPKSTNPSIKLFYENHYAEVPVINPALEIYDGIRIKKIFNYWNDKQARTLVVGCGNKNDQKIINSGTKSIAFDLSLNAVHSIKNSATVFNADALAIPINSNSIDFVVASEVLEHIPDVSEVVNEFYRILRTDGTLILSTPNWFSLFGLSRWVGERLFRVRLASDNQPFDDWKTLSELKRLLGSKFSIEHVRGVWYHFPMHYRGHGIPKILTRIIYYFFWPLEELFSFALPFFGHLIIIKARRIS